MIYARTNSGLPPNGFIFKDPRVPAMVWNDASFVQDLLPMVLRFRHANPQIYDPEKDLKFLEPEHVKQEILRANFDRLGGSPQYFYTTAEELPAPKPAPSPNKPKCNCGVALEPKFCKTCSMPKLIGYYCPSCKETWIP